MWRVGHKDVFLGVSDFLHKSKIDRVAVLRVVVLQLALSLAIVKEIKPTFFEIQNLYRSLFPFLIDNQEAVLPIIKLEYLIVRVTRLLLFF